MKLFIDTHSEKVTVAIIAGSKVIHKEKESDRSHSEVVVPLIEEMLKSENMELRQVEEIVVVNGPGSFTGVRIGVTIAKTIAFSLNIPIKTISSLEMYGVSADGYFDIVAIEDSKGVYSAHKENGEYTEFMYQRKKEFTEYIERNGFTVLDESKIDYARVFEYTMSAKAINPHKVNPIYIKEIDALK